MTNFIAVSTNEGPVATQIADEDCFPQLADLLEDLLTPQLELGSDPLNPDQQYGLYVERLALDVPLELQTLRNSNNEFDVRATFPTQWIETSVQPVLHRMRLTLELDDTAELDNADDHSGNQALES